MLDDLQLHQLMEVFKICSKNEDNESVDFLADD